MRTAHYVCRRIAAGAVLMIGISVLSFTLSSLVPGDYFDEMRLNPQVSLQTVAQLRSQYGLDENLPHRYVHWLKNALTGNFGFSFAYNMPVSSLLGLRLINTLLLAGLATALVWIVAVPVGILSARFGWADRISSIGSAALLSVPELALILVLLALFVRMGTMPLGGAAEWSGSAKGWSGIGASGLHLLIPVLALVIVGLPIVIQHTSTAMKEVLESPFIQAAKGHGISSPRLLLRHALPAAANPLISLFGLSLAGLVGTSLLAEVVTGWPGLGPLFVQSIFARDFYVVIAIVVVSSSFLVIGNLVGDVLLFAADPRIRRTNS